MIFSTNGIKGSNTNLLKSRHQSPPQKTNKQKQTNKTTTAKTKNKTKVKIIRKFSI